MLCQMLKSRHCVYNVPGNAMGLQGGCLNTLPFTGDHLQSQQLTQLLCCCMCYQALACLRALLHHRPKILKKMTRIASTCHCVSDIIGQGCYPLLHQRAQPSVPRVLALLATPKSQVPECTVQVGVLFKTKVSCRGCFNSFCPAITPSSNSCQYSCFFVQGAQLLLCTRPVH